MPMQLMTQPRPQSAAPPPQPDRRHHILVVDDELGPRQALNMLLKETYRVSVAPDVSSARVLLATHDFDAVITDLRMPRETGIDLLRFAHQHHRDVQVIILTGYGELDTAMKAVEFGAFAYLEKPFDTDEMLDYVGRAVARRQELLDKMRLEQLALEANRFETVGRVVSGMIHDLGTPLSVINTSIEMDLHKPELAPLEDHFHMLLNQVSHCREIVRSTLNFLRRQEREWSTTDLNEAVEAALKLARPMLRDHQVRIEATLASRLPAIRLEGVLFRQALLNLINNACQALDETEEPRHIYITTRCDGDMVAVTVRDTGPGIPEALREQIFESFYSTKGRHGTGLGLAVVQNVMREHGGDVSLDVGGAGGASFTLRFPIPAAR